jgi:hypothetical protein
MGRGAFNNRTLNNRIVKDKFPIPVVEELLDELRDILHQTRLAFRVSSSPHAPRQHREGASHTHQGLIKFLVMPFGLTNAPAMFQALMNKLL